jgi:MFS family permease
MVFCAPLSGMIGNVIGLRWVLVFGTLGYVPYSAALYCNSKFGTQWFLLFGAATCGLSAAALWTAEAAIGVGYPEPAKRGVYSKHASLFTSQGRLLNMVTVAIWLALSKLGQIIGSSIQLALNAQIDQKGSISLDTYLVLVGLQCLGLPLSLLLSPPEKLIREDGTKPTFSARKKTFLGEVKAFWKIATRKHIALLIPIFITVQWGQTYEGNFLAKYFTVRARALSALIISFVGVIVNLLAGWLLDRKRVRRSLRSKISWIALATIFTAAWIWNLIIAVDYSRTLPSLDYTSPGFGAGAGAYIFYRLVIIPNKHLTDFDG